jgi:hypothetical protein
MKTIRMIIAGAALLGVTACANTDTATRNAPAPTQLNAIQMQQVQPKNYKVVDYNVRVPANLRVSEANTYYPVADIVWRDDPAGDRHMQVARIIQTSLECTMPLVQGERPVKVNLELQRFHSLTEKARYTVGGVHYIVINMEVVDAQTGQIIEPMHRIEANLPALGGAAAVAADACGNTQKKRVTEFLAQTFAREFGATPIRSASQSVELSRQ